MPETTPHSPPIATPESARSTRNTVSVGAKPKAISIAEKIRMLAIRAGLRPYLSAKRPNSNEQMTRSPSVRVMPQLMVVMDAPNSRAMSPITKIMMKKSNASIVQPKKQARTTWYCCALPYMVSSGRSWMLLRRVCTAGTARNLPPRCAEAKNI